MKLEFVNANLSTHTTALLITIMTISVKHFLNDPHATYWLDAHWFGRNLLETGLLVFPLFGVYLSPKTDDSDSKSSG